MLYLSKIIILALQNHAQVKILEFLPEIDVVNSSPSELLASPLNITIQQNVNEDDNSSSQIQEPMETIPVEQLII